MGMMKTEKKYTVPKPRGLKVTQKEAEILGECRAYLDSREDLCYRRVEGAGKFVAGKFIKSDMKGCPDLLILREGKMHLAELKVPGGSLSESQAEFISEFGKHGAVGGIVCSLGGLKAFLNGESQAWQVDTASGPIPLWY
jgi:hypothetical protein